MAEYTDRGSFIPYRKADIIELCVEDGKLNSEDSQKFREFCEILSAYYHFEFHEKLEKLKDNFAPFDPDSDTKMRVQPTDAEQKEMEGKLVDTLCGVLEKANYEKLSGAELEQALDEESLITLRMDVNFDDFDQMVFYHRGSGQEGVEVRKGLFKKEEVFVDTYDRVVMLLKFKDEEYFKKNKRKIKDLNFTPGKMYVYMYKCIPKADIEVLFPNVEISMNWKDRLMLIVPAIAGSIPVLLKVLPQLIFLIGIIALTIWGPNFAEKLGVQKKKYIFNIDHGYHKDLNENKVPDDLIQIFIRNKQKLSEKLKVTVEEADKRWLVHDAEKDQRYSIELDDQVLNVFDLDATKKLMSIIIASLSAIAILGGFVFRQYVKYKNKRIEFLKEVTDTLFFKNLDSNSGVFNMLIDAAEEEENKEVILAYYHLLTSDKPINQEELDDKIETWLEEKFDTQIDFDVAKALDKMLALKGKLEDEDSAPDVTLLTKSEDGHCQILSIDDSKTVIDYVWDNIYSYN